MPQQKRADARDTGEKPPPAKTLEDIQRALDKAMRHSFPSGDIEDILWETEQGRWAR